MSIPLFLAASIRSVPRGTVTDFPSIVMVTVGGGVTMAVITRSRGSGLGVRVSQTYPGHCKSRPGAARPQRLDQSAQHLPDTLNPLFKLFHFSSLQVGHMSSSEQMCLQFPHLAPSIL